MAALTQEDRKVIDAIVWRVVWTCSAIAGWALILGWLLGGIMPTDSTDFGRWNRSGMEIKTDAATGCEYLATRMGLTPRMAADGSQMGCQS